MCLLSERAAARRRWSRVATGIRTVANTLRQACLVVFACAALCACTDGDLLSAGTARPSRRMRFLTWFAERASLHPDEPASSRRLFWSCRPGRTMAHARAAASVAAPAPVTSALAAATVAETGPVVTGVVRCITDAQHEGVASLFRCCSLVQPLLRCLSGSGHGDAAAAAAAARAGYAASSVYASGARGDAHVYVGSDKASEACGFHVGNNLWEAELPVLRRLQDRGLVHRIVLHTAHPISPRRMPLWRRQWHPALDAAERRLRFVGHCRVQREWDEWRERPPRPCLAYGRLLHYARHWRRLSRLPMHSNKSGRGNVIGDDDDDDDARCEESGTAPLKGWAHLTAGVPI